MFADHKLATAVGAAGLLVVLGHVLGPEIVPPAVGIPGAALAAVSAAYLALANRRVEQRAGSNDGRSSAREP
jgi:hypothetical protein